MALQKAGNSTNLIDNLSNIFFEQIFEKIDTLADQVRMARAYPQFMETILKMWCRRDYFRFVGPNTDYLMELDIDDYVIFMQAMRNNFTKFLVHEDGFGSFSEFYDYITHLCDINIHCFPNVETAVLCGNPDTMVDEDIRDLTLILPNLKRLITCMNISGLYIRGFRHLEELSFRSIYHSVPLSSCCIQEICLIMKNLRVLDITDYFDSEVRLYDIQLPNLEVLKINLSSVEYMIDKVMQLPKLKRLCVRFDDSRQLNAAQDNILQEIILSKSEIITGIALNNEVVQLHDGWYSSIQLRLPKLRKLVCENWSGSDLFLNKLYIPYELLEVVSFSGWAILHDFNVTDIVRNCPKLRQLHLSEYHSTLDMLERLVHIRQQDRIPNREALLVFSDTHWDNVDVAEQKKWLNNKFVRMCMESAECDFQDDGFEINFE